MKENTKKYFLTIVSAISTFAIIKIASMTFKSSTKVNLNIRFPQGTTEKQKQDIRIIESYIRNVYASSGSDATYYGNQSKEIIKGKFKIIDDDRLEVDFKDNTNKPSKMLYWFSEVNDFKNELKKKGIL